MLPLKKTSNEAAKTKIRRAGEFDEFERIGRAGLVGVDFVYHGDCAGSAGNGLPAMMSPNAAVQLRSRRLVRVISGLLEDADRAFVQLQGS